MIDLTFIKCQRVLQTYQYIILVASSYDSYCQCHCTCALKTLIVSRLVVTEKNPVYRSNKPSYISRIA